MSLPNPVTLPVLDVQALSRQHEPTGELINKAVPGAKEFYPLTEPAIGTALPAVCASSYSGNPAASELTHSDSLMTSSDPEK